MLRKVLGVFAGFLVGSAVVLAVEAVNAGLHPPPPGLDLKDRTAVGAFISTLPLGAFLLLLLAYALGSFSAGLVATLVSGRASIGPALVIGIVQTLAGAANLVMIPHPLWFAVVSTAVFLPMAWLGARVVLRRRSAAVFAPPTSG